MWTKEHSDYLERQIVRLINEERGTESSAAKEVFRALRLAAIGLRRPVDHDGRLCPYCQELAQLGYATCGASECQEQAYRDRPDLRRRSRLRG
jgi:hypothetical protein